MDGVGVEVEVKVTTPLITKVCNGQQETPFFYKGKLMVTEYVWFYCIDLDLSLHLLLNTTD